MCESDSAVYEIASDHRTAPELLARLAKSDDDSVRFAVAYSEAASARTLWELSRHPYTCHAVAANESTPARCLEELAGHHDGDIRLKVARNRSTSSRALRKLARDKNIRIRMAVACHLATPPAALAELACSEDSSIRWHVVVNDAIPPKVLLRLVNDEDESVRALSLQRLVELFEANLKGIRSLSALRSRSSPAKRNWRYGEVEHDKGRSMEPGWR
jgi:predicted RNA-binding protein YlxR (DUF448 family)